MEPCWMEDREGGAAARGDDDGTAAGLAAADRTFRGCLVWLAPNSHKGFMLI